MRQCLAHVVNGQGGNAGAGEGLHFNAGFVMHTHGAADHGRIAVEINGDAAALEAERVTDRALKLVGETCPDKPVSATDVVVPVSLQEKMQRLQALVNQREQAGANLQAVGELMQGFESLMQQKKFSEAEALVDRAFMLLGESGIFRISIRRILLSEAPLSAKP